MHPHLFGIASVYSVYSVVQIDHSRIALFLRKQASNNYHAIGDIACTRNYVKDSAHNVSPTFGHAPKMRPRFS